MATMDELTAKSRDELVAMLPAEIGPVAKNASKEAIAKAILYFEGETRTAGALRKIVLLDPANQRTTLDLATGTFASVAMGRTIPDAIVVEGSGDVMTLHLSEMYLYGNEAIEFDPPPDLRPIRVTFSE